MDVAEVLAEIQKHPRILDAGMILTHLGRVRSFSLKGGRVLKLRVRHDEAKAEAIRRELLSSPGVVDIVIRLNQGVLEPGDPIMICAVAGETRPDVFPVMERLIARLKAEASDKTEEIAG